MGQRSAEVDAYIAAAQPFARPLLEKIRKAFHDGCPDVTEVMKWSFPHFDCRGLVGSMAAFKAHVSLGFWKGEQLSDPEKLFDRVGKTRMAALKIRSADEMPPHKTLVAYVREAVALNGPEAAQKKAGGAEPKARRQATPLEVPAELEKALSKNRAAREAFSNFSASHRNEYVEWITEAKQEATREKRISTAIEWLSEGKPRNWKYMKERR